jgi:hypothetical protein
MSSSGLVRFRVYARLNSPFPPNPSFVTCLYSTHSFVFRGDLKKHATSHLDPSVRPRPYVCQSPGCGKAFYEASTLKSHDVVHTGARNYICSVDGCGRTFTQSGQLAKHRRLHDDMSIVPHTTAILGSGVAVGHELMLPAGSNSLLGNPDAEQLVAASHLGMPALEMLHEHHDMIVHL